MNKRIFAIAAHPDDIEFMMAGTLVMLGRLGWELHYMNVANGSCGSATMDPAKTAAVRSEEARAAARELGAVWHEPLVDDLQIYYRPELVARLGAVIRQVKPEILLTPSLQDYMEDHVNTARLALTATFSQGMPNFQTIPPAPVVSQSVAMYHALPYGLHDQLGDPVHADLYVNVESVMDVKLRALGCHRSQKEWLDVSQGIDSYLVTMQDMSAAMGKLSTKFRYAEGWRQHLHLGLGPAGWDPLALTLKQDVHIAKTRSSS